MRALHPRPMAREDLGPPQQVWPAVRRGSGVGPEVSPGCPESAEAPGPRECSRLAAASGCQERVVRQGPQVYRSTVEPARPGTGLRASLGLWLRRPAPRRLVAKQPRAQDGTEGPPGSGAGSRTHRPGGWERYSRHPAEWAGGPECPVARSAAGRTLGGEGDTPPQAVRRTERSSAYTPVGGEWGSTRNTGERLAWGRAHRVAAPVRSAGAVDPPPFRRPPTRPWQSPQRAIWVVCARPGPPLKSDENCF